MSVPRPSDGFRPDRPEGIDPGTRAVAAALTHAAAGWPVVPIVPGTKKPPTDTLRSGLIERSRIVRWWSNRRAYQVGVVLDGLRVVVLDMDGPLGEKSLTRLCDGTKLPSTYEVSTGRGRHLYYRIPPGGRLDLRSQLGHQHGRPELDVKMTWLMMAAGSKHKSGALYRASWDHVPRPEDLPVLPEDIWASIESHAGPATVGAVGSRGSQRGVALVEVPEDLSGGAPVTLPGPLGRRVEALLRDTSDGRDGRVFTVVSSLMRVDVPVPDIWATLMAAPLGDKVRSQDRPLSYFHHKVQSAAQHRAAADDARPSWDPDRWRSAVFAAGLSDAEVRVLVHLGGVTSKGLVAQAVGKIACGAALGEGNAGRVMEELRRKGWLVVRREHDPKKMSPRVHALQIPENGHILGAVSQAEEHTPPPLLEWSPPQYLTAYTGHDAFRAHAVNKGCPTLHGTFRLLGLLSEGPKASALLTEYLGCSQRTVRRLLALLRDAGLVGGDPTGYRLTEEPLGPLLDEAARSSGTLGQGRLQWERYLEECQQNAAFRRRMGTVGTVEWREAMDRDHLRMLARPEGQPLLDLWANREVGAPELASKLTSHYERLLDAAVECFDGFYEAA